MNQIQEPNLSKRQLKKLATIFKHGKIYTSRRPHDDWLELKHHGYVDIVYSTRKSKIYTKDVEKIRNTLSNCNNRKG